MNVVDAVRADHRSIASLFELFDRADASRDTVIAELARELTTHAAAEEALIDPEVRTVRLRDDDVVMRSVAEHQAIREALAKLEAQHDDDLEAASRVHELAALVHSHIDDEEANVLPALAEFLPGERLDELGRQFERAKRVAPTHAHPLAGPAGDGGGKAVNLVAGVADRVRDAVSRVRALRRARAR